MLEYEYVQHRHEDNLLSISLLLGWKQVRVYQHQRMDATRGHQYRRMDALRCYSAREQKWLKRYIFSGYSWYIRMLYCVVLCPIVYCINNTHRKFSLVGIPSWKLTYFWNAILWKNYLEANFALWITLLLSSPATPK